MALLTFRGGAYAAAADLCAVGFADAIDSEFRTRRRAPAGRRFAPPADPHGPGFGDAIADDAGGLPDFELEPGEELVPAFAGAGDEFAAFAPDDAAGIFVS